MKYVFFGTPEFSANILDGLIRAGFPPVALVCNPDRPVGRKQVITPPPTKAFIEKQNIEGIEVFQPETKDELLKMSDEIFENADFGIVASYSKIIQQEVIDKAKLGIIGVHPSLLPKLRGASPIQSAILTGEAETGVTLYLLDKKVDHGEVLSMGKITLDEQNYDELLNESADLAVELLTKILPSFSDGDITSEAQDESLATHTKKFSSEDGHIHIEDLIIAVDGTSPSIALAIHRVIRALNPEPGVYTMRNDKRVKLLASELKDGKLVLKRTQEEGKLPVDF